MESSGKLQGTIVSSGSLKTSYGIKLQCYQEMLLVNTQYNYTIFIYLLYIMICSGCRL